MQTKSELFGFVIEFNEQANQWVITDVGAEVYRDVDRSKCLAWVKRNKNRNVEKISAYSSHFSFGEITSVADENINYPHVWFTIIDKEYGNSRRKERLESLYPATEENKDIVTRRCELNKQIEAIENQRDKLQLKGEFILKDGRVMVKPKKALKEKKSQEV